MVLSTPVPVSPSSPVEERRLEAADAVVVGDGAAGFGAGAGGLLPGLAVPGLRVVVVGARDQEREVQRRAGRVQVGQVAGHRLGVRGQGCFDAVVEPRDGGPEPGDLHRVHDHPGAERPLRPHDLREGLHRVVAVLPPVLAVAGAEFGPRGSHDLGGGLLPGVQARRAGRETGQGHAPGRVFQGAEAQLRVGLVVPAQDGGAGLGSPDVLEGFGHGREVWVAEGQPLPGFRAGPAGERRLGDHGERPLRADQEPSQVRAGGRARHRAQAQDLAVRQDRGQPEQQVLDRAEPGRGLPGRRGRDPAADGGDRDRLRVVARGQSVAARPPRAGRRAPRPGPRPSGRPRRRGRCGPSGTGRARSPGSRPGRRRRRPSLRPSG